MGQLKQQTGTIRLGAKVSIGYYDQIQSELSYDKTAIDQLWDDYPHLTQTEVRNALASFLFFGDEVFKPITALSGGERARLLLLRLMLAHDNFLLLDEPTNHLDIASREALEQALEGYDGTLLIVSHDRYFMNRMATRIVQLGKDGCTSFDGNYDAYIEACNAAVEHVAEAPPVKENAYKLRKEQESQKRKLATKIRRLEEAIATCEETIAALETQLASPEIASQYEEVVRLSAELDEQNQTLDDLMTQWENAQQELENMA
jgi:ATP-binding cassette subfamily F protein 3